jgi:protein-tyrosine-phosphatase
MNKETAEKLLKIGVEMNDDDIIQMATRTLESISQRHSRESNNTKKNDNDFIFTMQNAESGETVKRNSMPVNKVQGRTNIFVDDGIEAKDVKTPDIKPTERKRDPFKMIEQSCAKCGRSYSTHPAHKRDYFICDKCIIG